MAARTGLLYREEALLHAHLTDAAAGGTGHRAGAFLCPGAIAGLALDQGRHADGHRGTAHGFFQIQLQRVTQVAAALSATAGAATTATEEIAEYIAEDVGEVGAAVTGSTCPGAHLRIDAGVPVLIVGSPLARVGSTS